jgi:hypothetical protein
MSQSNVGNAQVYEANDQRLSDVEEIKKLQEQERFHEGKENSHDATDPSTTLPCVARNGTSH